MSLNRIIAFSSSRTDNSSYLETAAPIIKDFLGEQPLKIAFIPFASVDNNYEGYVTMVREGLSGLPHTIYEVNTSNAKSVIAQSNVIMVGGGNTFKLLHDIYNLGLLDPIRDKVNAGVPYIGWSAGANITGPTIGTTNDMPVIEPKSFNALGLFPFQINPHYINQTIAGHNGETRDDRLSEFVKLNPGIPVVGLPEGTALLLEEGVLTFIGQRTGVLFTSDEFANMLNRREIAIEEDLSYLL